MKTIDIRRSVRQFKEKEVSKEKIEALLRAAMQAPSAGNQQPWEFLVVQNRDMLNKLSKMSPYATPIANGNLAVILLGVEDRMRFSENWEQDMSAATQNLLLEAVEQDLGGVWLGVSPLEDRELFVKDLFNLGEGYKPFAVVALGYPEKEDANKYVDRYDESRIHFESI
jgi:nitroreductase